MSTPPFLALPPGARSERWEVTRATLAVVVAEPAPVAAARGTAVLLPGFTGSKEDFVALLEPLMARGWRVVAVDLLGQYESTGPDDESAYALDLLGADVRDVVSTARGRWPQPLHLVGHSLGGLVARSAVLDARAPGLAGPDSDQRVVDTLTLLCSGPGALPTPRRPPLEALRAALPATPLADVWTVKEQLDRAAGWEPPSEEVLAFVRRRFTANSPYGLRAKAAALLGAADRVDELAAAASTRRLPVLVLHGEHDDAWTPEEQDEMATRLGALPLVIAGAGHSPAVDSPTATASLLDGFWRSGDPSRAEFPADEPGGSESFVTPRVTGVVSGYADPVRVETPLRWESSAPRTARLLLSQTLASWSGNGWGSTRRTEDAVLVLSELVTNAVRHGRAPVHLVLEVDDHRLRIEVSDGEPRRAPAARTAASEDPGGRGIALVNALVDRWGWARHPGGKVVWAEIGDELPQARSGGVQPGSTPEMSSTSVGASAVSARPSQGARVGAAR